MARWSAVAATVVVSTLQPTAIAQSQFNLIRLPHSVEQDGAMCLDGSPIGFYWQPGSGNGSYNWMVYFEGGGWCYSAGDCYGRSLTTLGSSKAWPATGSLGGLMSNDCAVNPTFCNWNRVWMPYCDGNSFSGMRVDPVNFNGTNLWFRGRYNIDSIMKAIQADVQQGPTPWSAAFDIVLTGCSAGGLATYLHADYFRSTFVNPVRPPPPGGPNRNGYYAAIPISGFFLNHPNVYGEYVYGTEMQTIHYLSNATYGVNAACIAGEGAGNEWHCNMAPYTYKYITSPIFPLNSAYDSWQSGCILAAEPVVFPNNTHVNGNCSAVPGWAACAKSENSCTSTQLAAYNEYRSSFIANMNGTVTAGRVGNGGFISSCHTHCEAQSNDFDVFTINGVTMQQAVGQWWASLGQDPASHHWYYDCQYKTSGNPVQCNPTCGSD